MINESFTKIENREQKTCETCLSVCLMVTLKSKGLEVKDEDEMKILVEGLKLFKLDFAVGQLIYVCKTFDVNIKLFIDSPLYYKILSKYDYPKNLELVTKRIDNMLLREMVKNKPLIVYVDKYYIDKIYHFPHFIVLEYMNKNKTIIMDPWDGKKKTLPSKILSRAISSLRNKLKISPKLIEVS